MKLRENCREQKKRNSYSLVVMVTHSPAYAEFGDRQVHLFDGHIVTENFKDKFHV